MLDYDIVAKVLDRSGTWDTVEGLTFKQTDEMWTYQEIQDSTGKGSQLNLNHNMVQEFTGSEEL